MPVGDLPGSGPGDERDPSMERRALLVTGVAFLVLIFWNSIIANLYPQPEKPAEEAPAVVAETPPDLSGPELPQPAPDTLLTPEVSPDARKLPRPVMETETKSAVVTTDLFEATFTNRGARLRSLKLRKYAESLPQPSEVSKPLETIPRPMIERDLLPLALQFPVAPELEEDVNGALYTVDPQRLELGPGETGTVTFHYRSADGISVTKRILFTYGSYLLEVETNVARQPTAPGETPDIPHFVSWGPGFSNPPPALKETEGSYTSYDYFGRAVYQVSGQTERSPKDKFPTAFELPSEVNWAGLEERYFAVVFLPLGRFDAVRYVPYRYAEGEDEENTELRLAVRSDGPFQLFVGPKDYEILKATHPSLPNVIDFGRWLGFLVKFLLVALRKIESVVGNYGLAIILLTILIRVALLPLTLKSYRSMKRMQKLQPKVNAIRERYKRLPSDPTERREAKMKMNEEMMALYRREGVNPVGGCFPLLLQMPFLFAFYGVLTVAIELRHEPFLLWIRDLSQMDPLYVTPVLMTLAQYLSQRLTPTPSADPVQQRMMQLMPLFFLFFFIKLPSGLVLYWLTSNLFQIGQQLIFTRQDAKPAPA